MSADEKPFVITDWAIVASAYDAPEVRVCAVRGNLGGQLVTTAGLQRKLGPLTYETQDGKVFLLEGPPDPGYVEYCKRNRIDLDLADPFKFRDASEGLKWAVDKAYVEKALGGRYAQ